MRVKRPPIISWRSILITKDVNAVSSLVSPIDY